MKTEAGYLTVTSLVCTLALTTCLPVRFAEGGQCTNGMWLKVLTDLEWTVKNDGAHKCVVDKIHGGETAYDAFKHCNDAFTDRGAIHTISNDYRDCGTEACNWFKAQNPPRHRPAK
jgi:hypothetical protein